MADVLAALRRDHGGMAQLFAAVERQLARFGRGETPDYDVLRGVLDYCLTYPDLYHHPKEDLVYARLSRLDPAAAAAVGDLAAEHRPLAEATRRFAAALRNLLQDQEVPREAFDRAAREFLDSHRRHIAMEEKSFFPAAEASLTAADWAAIEAELASRADPLSADVGEARYAALRADILAWAGEED